MSAHTYSYAGFPLTGVDEHGTEWTVERSSGWADGVGVRLDRETKAGQDGEWDQQSRRAAREVSLIGKAIAPSHAALERSGRILTGLPLLGEFVGETDGVALSGSARILDAPRFEHTFPTTATWQLTALLADPILYGPSMYATTILEAIAAGTGRVWPRVWPRDWGTPAGVTPGSITLPNVGTATYWPRLRIDGPVINPVVTLAETGAWVRIGRTIESGQWVDLDLGLRRVLLNGQVSIRSQVTFSGNWLGVPPGGASMSWAADTADPAALLHCWSHESAWN